ncbi:MAG: zinc-ribbon and DUF3426 domain-containing protein [Burkholderiales bacterium]
MALATRCPACGTTFRVVSDQLKLQNGLVKCGHCGVVFDGIEHMRYVKDVGSSKPTGASTLGPQVLPTALASDATDSVTEAQTEADVVKQETSDITATDTPPTKRRFFSKPGKDKEPHTAPDSQSTQDVPEMLDDSESPPHTPVELEVYDLPSFMLPDKKYSVAFRLLWGFFVLTAGLGLLLQITYWYRHEIVAFSDPRMPEIRTLILRSCQALPLEIDCTIKLPRHIERLKVSAAEVIETNTPGLYSLRLSLRNESQLPQAYPALDMTLSDARNSIVTRKILLPDQYLANIQGSNVGAARLILQGLAGQDEQSFILPIKIESEVNESVPGRVAGYLVEIFYP